jgi:hypothetical protein
MLLLGSKKRLSAIQMTNKSLLGISIIALDFQGDREISFQNLLRATTMVVELKSGMIQS